MSQHTSADGHPAQVPDLHHHARTRSDMGELVRIGSEYQSETSFVYRLHRQHQHLPAEWPFRKGLSGRGLRDSKRLLTPIWSLHVDPDHPRAL